MKNLNTFRNGCFSNRWLFKLTMMVMAVVFLVVSASALDPNRMVSQYIRYSWGVQKDFSGGAVTAIAQTADGYLWIGTNKGLVRFDGLNFRTFGQANSSSLAIGPVETLLTDRQGSLWILLRNTKLLRYHDGQFELIRGEAENGITAMGHGLGNSLLLSSLALGPMTYDGEGFESILANSGPAGSAGASDEQTPDQRSTRLSWSEGLVPDGLAEPHSAVISIAETSDAKLWLGTRDRGLFYSSNGQLSSTGKGLSGSPINCLLPLEGQELWIGTAKGVFRWNGSELTRSGVPSALLHAEVLSMLRDKDSNIWVGTSRGLLRFNANGVSSLTGDASGTDPNVSALFEDREGNLWIGSPRGLERLRDSAFVTHPFPGPKSQSIGPVYVDPHDRVWFAPIEGDLRRLNGRDAEPIQIAGLGRDVVYSITGDGNDLWLGRQRGGLTHLQRIRDSFVSESYTRANGLAQDSVFAVFRSRDGTIWSGTLSGGVSELRNGHFVTFTVADGLASNTVSSIEEGGDGTMWFGTPKGLSALRADRWRTYTVGDGLPSSDVNCLLRDSTDILWIGTASGLAFLSGNHIQSPQKIPDSLHEPIFGMAEDRNGWLWITTAGHVLRVKREGLMRDSLSESDAREYGPEDGLQGTEGVKRYRSVVADSRGNIWLATNRGISVVKPSRATINSAPALVHIEAVLADGSPLETGKLIKFPAQTQRATFRYVGLSLANSERVRYRYRLEGFDRGWSEPTTNREATYGNLSAAPYRFHVMASNSDGLWNGSEAVVGFEVEPTLWETLWFRLTCVFCGGLTALLVYWLRMRQLTRLLNVRFEGRLAERTRIAQELHDTFCKVSSVSRCSFM